MFLVSHDRRFLDNVVTSTIAWEGEDTPGLWREYEGGYEDWLTQRERSRQLLAAAEYARSQLLLDRMISTSDRTRNEFDFTQRFPSPFRDAMAQYAAPLGLDETWVYGLIRQESRR